MHHLLNVGHHAAATATTTRLYNKEDDDDSSLGSDGYYDPSISAALLKAKRLLEETREKQKLASETAAASPPPSVASAEETSPKEGEEEDTGTLLPFFAAKTTSSKKIKSKLETGQIVADGDAMTSLSATEPWERRSLSDLKFEREARQDYDGNLVHEEIETRGMSADRDLARNVYNLRKSLRNDDFERVFDKRNRFIGEVD